MEVHHHSHTSDPDSHRGRKKWTHYFREFLMLFLAVFCGFLAEYQLEHTIEKQREKKFVQLLYEDLKKDTISIRVILDIKKWRTNNIDSFYYYTSLPDLQKNANAIYYYTIVSGFGLPFQPSDATYQQMRSSGSLRYFHKPELYNAVSDYYATCAFYMEGEAMGRSRIQTGIMAKMFNGDHLRKIVTVTPDIRQAARYPTEPLRLLSVKPDDINELKFYSYENSLSNDVTRMLLKNSVETKLIRLMTLLKKEYYLQ